jgi:hypothetical protein
MEEQHQQQHQQCNTPTMGRSSCHANCPFGMRIHAMYCLLHLFAACRWGQELPQELQLQIFSLLPNRDKMHTAAVCTQWQQVADASCVDIELPLVSDTQWQRLQQWLPKRGLGVSNLSLKLKSYHNSCKLQLPPELCSLHLRGGYCAPGQLWLPQQVATSLTRLVLQKQVWSCTGLQQQLLLQEMSSCNRLQELSLIFRQGVYGTDAPVGGHLKVLEAVSGLQHLTRLELQGLGDSRNQQGEPLQYLAQLTKLQQLDLEVPDMHSVGGIDRLHSLTGLSLSGSNDITISADVSSDIGCLTSLRSLALKRCALSATAVPMLTALTSLHLGLACGSYAAVLTLLRQLPSLAVFSMDSLKDAGGVAPAAYAALTHSSHLQQLDISNASLPRAAWLHVFRAGQQLPQLHSLWLPKGVLPQPLAAYEVQALAHCCPALAHLDGGGMLAIEVGLSSLTGLTQLRARQAAGRTQAAALGPLARLQVLDLTPSMSSRSKKWVQWDFQPLVQVPLLTRLEVAGSLSDAAAGVLRTLVGLADLTVDSLTEQQLRRLTRLTGLTRLTFCTDELGVLLVDRLIYQLGGTDRRRGRQSERVVVCNKVCRVIG